MKVEIEVPEGFELAHFQLKRIGAKSSNGRPKNDSSFWANVNWDKSNYEIAEEVGKCYLTVLKARKAYGKPTLRTRKLAQIDWRNLDWTKNNQQIGAETGVDVNTVRKIRIRLKAPSHKPSTARMYRVVTEEMISAVDWEFTRDIDISKRWHVSRERVRQIRQQRGFPVCTIGFFDTMSRDFAIWLVKNKESIKGKIAKDVADSYPVNFDIYRKLLIMRKSGIPFIFQKLRTSIAVSLPINWQLPNILLDNIWNKCRNWAANCRSKYSFQAPLYDCRFKPLAEFVRLNALEPLILAEVAKAKELGITPRDAEWLAKLTEKYE